MANAERDAEIIRNVATMLTEHKKLRSKLTKDGTWKLTYTATGQEVFPGLRFKSPQSARAYYALKMEG